ncbi:PREDICTED: toll-like receptor 7 [Gekko japonicus]|uniref:Toll-like receptor 7 n=1 Tax=Gekko japonicus TaxID=146911 RepID=A0ABM1LB34_GEKJA|nr:PREDICTED: toll-like receptor 7 [Gekko japonicus]
MKAELNRWFLTTKRCSCSHTKEREKKYLRISLGRSVILPWDKSRLFFFLLCLFPKMVPAIQYPKTLPCDVSFNVSEDLLIVDCRDRRLVTFPEGIPANTTNLTLSINHIEDIKPANFEHLENLVEVDFRCNCMPFTMGPKDHICTKSLNVQHGTFEKLTHLKSLYLDGNQLSEVPRGLPQNLSLLSLEANHIIAISKESLKELGNIEILLLGKNCYYRNSCNVTFQIDNTAFQALKKLTVLSLKANNLSSIPQNLPHSLKKLYIHDNQIQNVSQHDLNYLHNLEVLDLSGNCPRCHNAPYPCEPCANNKSLLISPTAFASLKQLKFLRLHSTSLHHVNPKWFENTRNLERLDLSQNYLAKEIEEAKFLNFLPNLLDLDLSFNYELQEYPTYLNLPRTFSNLTKLKYLRLRGYVFKTLNLDTVQYLRNLINLTELDFGTNFIRNADFNMFKDFPALQIINLSFNKISPSSEGFSEVPFYSSHVPLFGQYKEMHYFVYDEYSRSCSSKDREMSPSLPHGTEPSCTQYGKTLDLSRNNMFFINPSDFQNFASIKCLNLSGNAMSQTLHGKEFRSLSGLKYLDFSNNRIDLLYSNAFQELKELEILDLSDNKYYFQAEGVTHMLNFTSNLTSLKKLILNGNEIFTSEDKGMKSSSIQELEFRKNRLDILWKAGTKKYLSFFKELKCLKNLDISDNSLSYLPDEVFDGLPEQLQQLNLSNNKLKTFTWWKFKVLKNLTILDLRNNLLTTVPSELSNCSGALQNLTLQHNRIKRLAENFLRGAFQLRYLDLSFNKIRTIRNSSFPPNVINKLNILLLNGNPFKCDCDIVWLAWWMNRTKVTIPRLATDVTCTGPGAWKGKGVVLLNLDTCELDYSQILYCASASIIMSLMMFTLTSHLYFWDVWYIYHFCTAKLKGYKRLSSKVWYDAFVAYDIKDAAVNEWVLKELVEKLENEEEKQFNLCLEERDWLPGQPVLDNLSESIEMSRKTIFVLTNRYIACGNFRTAFYLAHQRLMDEKVDVIILIFLEKVLQKSKYLRLRKRLCSRSVLEWPTNPQSQCYFWHCLKNALAVNNDVSYNILFKEIV